jgi:hypothetical protein
MNYSIAAYILQIMALYTAAAMHDFDHPGRTNAFLVASEDRKVSNICLDQVYLSISEAPFQLPTSQNFVSLVMGTFVQYYGGLRTRAKIHTTVRFKPSTFRVHNKRTND